VVKQCAVCSGVQCAVQWCGGAVVRRGVGAVRSVVVVQESYLLMAAASRAE
jgi:hypothetical protein